MPALTTFAKEYGLSGNFSIFTFKVLALQNYKWRWRKNGQKRPEVEVNKKKQHKIKLNLSGRGVRPRAEGLK